MTVFSQDTFASAFSVTCSLASLASTTAEPPVGRESAYVDWTSYLGFGATVAGEIKLGTSPTDNKQIFIWAVPASYNGSTYRWPAGFAGSDAGVTPDKNYWTSARLVHVIDTPNTTGKVCKFAGAIIPFRFMPIRFSLFIHHNTGVTLDSTGGNHVLEITPFQFKSV